MNLAKLSIQFFKFAVVGVLNTGVDWGMFFLLRLLPFFAMAETLAKGISFWVAATNSFVLNSLWTFREEFEEGMEESKSKLARGSAYYIKFMLVSIVGCILNTWIFSFARHHLFPADATWARLLSLALASGTVMIWNFSANKWWTYRERS